MVKKVTWFFCLTALIIGLESEAAAQVERASWRVDPIVKVGGFVSQGGIYRTSSSQTSGNWVVVSPSAAVGLGVELRSPTPWISVRAAGEFTIRATMSEREEEGNPYHGHGPDGVSVSAGSVGLLVQWPRAGMVEPYLVGGLSLNRFEAPHADLRAVTGFATGAHVGVGVRAEVWGHALALEAVDHVHRARPLRLIPSPGSLALPYHLYPPVPVHTRHGIFIGLVVTVRGPA